MSQTRDELAQCALRRFDVLVETLEYHTHADRLFLLVPNVVVRHQGQNSEAKFRLACQPNFGHGGHPDDVEPPRPVEVRFSACRKLWALDTQVCTLVMYPRSSSDRRLNQGSTQLRAEGLVQRDVHDWSLLVEKRTYPPHGPIDDLIRDDEIERCDPLAQAPDGTHRDDPTDSQGLQGPKVGPCGDAVRTVLVVPSVPWNEGDSHATKSTYRDHVAGRPEWRLDSNLFDLFEIRHAVEAAPADNPEFDRHFVLPQCWTFDVPLPCQLHYARVTRVVQLQDNIAVTTIPRQRGSGVVRATLAVSLALLLITWWLTVIARLSTLGLPSDMAEHVLRPGTIPLPDARVDRQGDWVLQSVGNETFLATRTAGDRLVFTIAGTEILLALRLGPDAGQLLVSVDQETMPRIFSLRRATVRVESLVVISGLSPGLHRVTIANGENGELAVSAIVVRNRPSVWWAFFPPLGIGLIGLGWLLRVWWQDLLETLGWWPARVRGGD